MHIIYASIHLSPTSHSRLPTVSLYLIPSLPSYPLLHYTMQPALMNSPMLARRLLKAGADLYTINRAGKDPLDLAAIRENTAVLKVTN